MRVCGCPGAHRTDCGRSRARVPGFRRFRPFRRLRRLRRLRRFRRFRRLRRLRRRTSVRGPDLVRDQGMNFYSPSGGYSRAVKLPPRDRQPLNDPPGGPATRRPRAAAPSPTTAGT
ncbi:hypothetical protein DN402_33685 [Streptomyces sp. SW4]|nr:hypothetical protein DN402_33685 [Streptomyces sp. SW4]